MPLSQPLLLKHLLLMPQSQPLLLKHLLLMLQSQLLLRKNQLPKERKQSLFQKNSQQSQQKPKTMERKLMLLIKPLLQKIFPHQRIKVLKIKQRKKRKTPILLLQLLLAHQRLFH